MLPIRTTRLSLDVLQRSAKRRSNASNIVSIHGSCYYSFHHDSCSSTTSRHQKNNSSSFRPYSLSRSIVEGGSSSLTQDPRKLIALQKLSFSSAGQEGAMEDDATTQNSIGVTRQIPHIRNVAIVAHVDHGKTTIVDQLLRCASESIRNMGADGSTTSSSAKDKENTELVMDCGDLERERGITITSKVTRLDYRQQGSSDDFKIINVVDTPGHADFAGEVDRILTMIDGVCLVVDAAEGAMAQTKYVLSRALKMGLKPVVVLNKCDKEDAWSRIEDGEVEVELLETFDSLGANEEQMEYVTVYASGKAGWATRDMEVARQFATGEKKGPGSDNDNETSMRVLLDTILECIPPPVVSSRKGIVNLNDEPFAMAATTVGRDNFLGRLCTGRIYSGTISKNDEVALIPRDFSKEDIQNSSLYTSCITGMFVNRGVSRTELESAVASAGDIVTLAGVPDSIAVGDTLTLKSNPINQALATPPINPPTLSMEIGANTSPLAGKEGAIVASSRVRDRLFSETDNNVTLSVTKSETDAERSVVHARGELQLGILIEEMRREGFELTVSPPKIITKKCESSGEELEPFEEVTVDVDSEHSGTVIDSLTGARKGVLLQMSDSADGKTRLIFEIPSRGLLGFQSEIATATRGTAVVNHLFLDNRSYAGHIGGVEKGKLVSNDTGKANLYALANLAKRGTLFIEPGEVVYSGMVIGENSRPGDLEVNPVRSKEASNVRTVNKDEKLYVPPPKRYSIEELIGYMNEDEVLEVTPKSIRLRKAELDPGVRERLARSRKKQMMAGQKSK
mmetsp:Transcript_13695/g.25760  ORF Transcript_13695/g.25760 Transcript_13695/m.25760 type:complete len:795 (-) Transcript_13695:3641-6025(-)